MDDKEWMTKEKAKTCWRVMFSTQEQVSISKHINLTTATLGTMDCDKEVDFIPCLIININHDLDSF